MVITPVRCNENNQVFRLDYNARSLYLKTGPALAREYERLRWLEGRLSAPQPLGFSSRDGQDALLMSAVPGDDLAVLCGALPPQEIVTRLAAALNQVHATNIADWPFGGTGTLLVHGDACLPNFLYQGH